MPSSAYKGSFRLFRPPPPRNGWIVTLRKLTFFTQISGRNFLPELCGEVHPGAAPLQALLCTLFSTEQSTFRGEEKGEKVPKKGEEEGSPTERAKRKKGRVKTGQFRFGEEGSNACRVSVAKPASSEPTGTRTTMRVDPPP